MLEHIIANMIRPFLITAICLLCAGPALALDLAETRTLAEQGDAWYQTELALMYHHGKGLPKNYEEAAQRRESFLYLKIEHQKSGYWQHLISSAGRT